MKKVLVGFIVLLMIVGSLIDTSTIQASSLHFLPAPAVIKKIYASYVIKGKMGAPISGYFASSNGADTFYVLADQASVKNYSATISVGGCGTYKITHTMVETITNSQFAFTGSFYASGTFSSSTTATGSVGFNAYNISGCGAVTGGPWSWNASWKNSNQPDIREAFPVTEDAPNLALPDETTIVEKIE